MSILFSQKFHMNNMALSLFVGNRRIIDIRQCYICCLYSEYAVFGVDEYIVHLSLSPQLSYMNRVIHVYELRIAALKVIFSLYRLYQH